LLRISSAMPSAKYASALSPRFSNENTASRVAGAAGSTALAGAPADSGRSWRRASTAASAVEIVATAIHARRGTRRAGVTGSVPEALGVDREGHFTVEELEGDRPIVPEIARDVHGGHAAATQHALELVATAKGEGGTDPVTEAARKETREFARG
jgi:hypothetical protein